MSDELNECPWCKHNPSSGCGKDEAIKEKCDFRTLPFEKEAILERMKAEWKICVNLRSEIVKLSGEDAERAVCDLLDRTNGIMIMSEVLISDFGVRRGEIKDYLEVEKPSVIESLKLMAKLKKMELSRGKKS